MIKYPRTPHLAGSHVHDDDRSVSPAETEKLLAEATLIVAEKLDGSNVGVFFEDGELRMQSRGHVLGGHDHPSFDLFKRWGSVKRNMLWELLGEKYLMYGEWLYAVHTVKYTALPHYFMEFDILDRAAGRFLSTACRRELLAGTGIVSAPVLYEGVVGDMDELLGLVVKSLYGDDTMEGLYIKHEDENEVRGRYKYVRPEFKQELDAAAEHWRSKPVEVQPLAAGIDILG